MFRCFKIQLFPWNSCWLTLHKLCCTSLCVRTNLIYDTLTQNKQSFSVHILGFIDRRCLLNGQIYLTFHKTRQLGRKWCLWVYIKKPTTSFFSWNSYKAQTWMKPLACLCVKTHFSGQSWLLLLTLQSSVMKQQCSECQALDKGAQGWQKSW